MLGLRLAEGWPPEDSFHPTLFPGWEVGQRILGVKESDWTRLMWTGREQARCSESHVEKCLWLHSV